MAIEFPPTKSVPGVFFMKGDPDYSDIQSQYNVPTRSEDDTYIFKYLCQHASKIEPMVMIDNSIYNRGVVLPGNVEFVVTLKSDSPLRQVSSIPSVTALKFAREDTRGNLVGNFDMTRFPWDERVVFKTATSSWGGPYKFGFDPTGPDRYMFRDWLSKNQMEYGGTPEPPVPTTKTLEPVDVSQLTDFYSHVVSTSPAVDTSTKSWTELPIDSSVDIKFTFDIKPQTITFNVLNEQGVSTTLSPTIDSLIYTYTIPIDAVKYNVVADFTPPPPPEPETKTITYSSSEAQLAEFLKNLESTTPPVSLIDGSMEIFKDKPTPLTVNFTKAPTQFKFSTAKNSFSAPIEISLTKFNDGKSFRGEIPSNAIRYTTFTSFPVEPEPTPTTRTIKYSGRLDDFQDLLNHTSSIMPTPNSSTGDIEEVTKEPFPLVIIFNEEPLTFHFSVNSGELSPTKEGLKYTYTIPADSNTYFFTVEWKPLPPPPVSTSNLFTVYAPTAEQISAFDTYRRVETADQITYPQYQHVLSYRRFFCPVITDPELKTFRAKDIDFGSQAKVVSQLIQTIDCGTLNLKDSKLITSYSPFTTYRIFLPFIGFQNLSDDDIIGDRINLSYEIDFTSGQCLAIVKCFSGENLIATNEYSGLISQDFPLGNSSFVRSGSYAVVAARIMGSLKPYIIKTQRTIPNTPDYPLFKTIKEVDVSQLTGFNVIDRIIPPSDTPFEGSAEMFNNLMDILHKGINFS